MSNVIQQDPLIFFQIHIDAARNSTDDFNLFHDKNKWNRITDNPFGGPIVLGFQLECLIEDRIRCYRENNNEVALITEKGLRFSNYQFSFANVVKPGEIIQVDIKKSQYKPGDNPTLGNRVAIKNAQGVVLIGHKKESHAPLFLGDIDLDLSVDLKQVPDRSFVDGTETFYKRKYMSNGNAKNFLSGSLVEQSIYFDELEDKVNFPEMYPAALISCALLERGFKVNHDFEKDPMVYTSHSISIDRQLAGRLKSNDILHMLVSKPVEIQAEKGLGKSGVTRYMHHCFGLLANHDILFRAEIALAPLAAILKRS